MFLIMSASAVDTILRNEQLRQFTITRHGLIARKKVFPAVYKSGGFIDNPTYQFMAPPKNKQEARLQELILSARRRNIQVRTEKLLREAGYRAKSGSCRIKGQNVILLDRDARIADQIDFLAAELAELENESVGNLPGASEN
jgi:hypothetical protein